MFFHVLAHVPRLGEGRGVADGEGDGQGAGQGLGQQGLAAAGGAHQQDVGLVQFHLGAGRPRPDALEVVIDGHAEGLLGPFLADDVVVQAGVNLAGDQGAVGRRLGDGWRRVLGLD